MIVIILYKIVFWCLYVILDVSQAQKMMKLNHLAKKSSVVPFE